MALTRKSQIALAQMLGRTDAPWLPVRREWSACGIISDARQESRTGIPSRACDDAPTNDAERKRAQRIVSELVAAGLLTRDPKRYVVALTAQGFRTARSLAWPVVPADFAEVSRRLAERTAAGDCFERLGQSGWVAEPFLCGEAWGEQTDPIIFEWLADHMLPLLMAGLVESNASTVGHVCYRLTAGPISDSALAELVAPDGGDAFDDELCRVYLEHRTAARRRLVRKPGRSPSGNIGPIPLVLHPTASGRAFADLRNIEPLPAFREVDSDA